jgi:hypothetical protein
MFLNGLTVTLSDVITVQLVGVTCWGVLLLLQWALAEISFGDAELSLWGENDCGGVLGLDELVGGDGKGWWNKLLATLDARTIGPVGVQFCVDDPIIGEGWKFSWVAESLSDCLSVPEDITSYKKKKNKQIQILRIRNVQEHEFLTFTWYFPWG